MEHLIEMKAWLSRHLNTLLLLSFHNDELPKKIRTCWCLRSVVVRELFAAVPVCQVFVALKTASGGEYGGMNITLTHRSAHKKGSLTQSKTYSMPRPMSTACLTWSPESRKSSADGSVSCLVFWLEDTSAGGTRQGERMGKVIFLGGNLISSLGSSMSSSPAILGHSEAEAAVDLGPGSIRFWKGTR